jgi:hypothetical protein
VVGGSDIDHCVGLILAELFLHYVGLGLRGAVSMLAWRAFPVTVALSVDESRPAMRRLLSIGGYCLLAQVAAIFTEFQPAVVAFTYVYLLAAVSGLYAISGILRHRIVVLPLAGVLFLLVPGTALATRSNELLLLLGWELVLSIYSYCVERRLGRSGGSWFECVSFVLVNPAIVYPRRGKVVSASVVSPGGRIRVLRGTLAMACACAIGAARADSNFGDALSSSVAAGGTRLLQTYFGHLGLAAMQIGLVCELGWVLPERYLSPIRATSPKDFWRRWNTYVGGWLRMYIFVPLAFAISRRTRKAKHPIPSNLIQVACAMSCFLFIGVLHDLYLSAAGRQLTYVSTIWFAGNGLLLVVWEIGAIPLGKRVSLGAAGRMFRHVIVVGVAVLCMAVLR